MEQLQYLKYNNYFNHVHKPSYMAPIDYWNATNTPAAERVLLKQNFVPGDGVNTTHTLGKGEAVNEYDYLVVYTDTETPTVISRWFIIKSDRLRGGQWSLTLKRDTISDYYDNLLNAPAIIERAKVDADNPLIFNKEQFTYNQIQREEPILLKDETKVPWAVAYIPLDTAATTITCGPLDGIITAGSEFPYAAGFYKVANSIKYYINWSNGVGALADAYTSIIKPTFYETEGPKPIGLQALRANMGSQVSLPLYNMVQLSRDDYNSKAADYLKHVYGNYLTDSDLTNMLSYKDRIVQVNSKLYRVSINQVSSSNREVDTPISDTTQALYSKFNTDIVSSGIFNASYDTIDPRSVKINNTYTLYSVSYEEVRNSDTATYTVPAARKHNDSGLYDIICFPIGALDIYNGNTKIFTTDEQTERSAAINLGIALSGGIYDIQLLPYCPVRNTMLKDGKININGKTANTDYTFITKSGNNVGILFYVSECNFTFDIQQKLEIEQEEVNTGRTTAIAQPFLAPETNKEYTIKPTDEITTIEYFPNIDNTYYMYWYGSAPNALECYAIDTRDYSIADRYYASGIRLNLSHTTDQDVHKATVTTIEITDVNGVIGRNYVLEPEYYKDSPYRTCVKFVTSKLLDADTPLSPDLPHNAWDSLFGTPVYVPEDAALAVKVDSECSFERLVSPNYQGTFEFCVAKNGGVDYFNVDMTLKPYNPYIHVNPNFKNMYGGDYDEAKGLVCNGDFSFGQLTDAFRSYELQNKNYEAIFNRQIQSMDIEQGLQRKEARWSIAAGVGQGLATGVGMGVMTGNPALGVGLGALATGASIGAGIADYGILKERQAEQKDLALDMHEFQLGNIRALPYSLTKCPAFTYNNKLFPFIERYSATDEEVKILKNYLSLRSFNINAMGSIGEYIQDQPTFIKGQLIRLDELHCPTNIANDLYNEINQGVYM